MTKPSNLTDSALMVPNLNEKFRDADLSKLRQMHRKGIYIYALPNLLTAANFVFGFIAIIFSIQDDFVKAAYCLLIAAIFDLFDGRVARITKTTSQFGAEFDSLCDLVSFGVAPALLLYLAALEPFGRLGLAAAIGFAICGALRLARFNVFVLVLPKSYFQGLPIPVASATLAMFIIFCQHLGYSIQGKIFPLVLVVSHAVLMVSTVRFPSFKDFNWKNRKPYGLFISALILLSCIFIWFEITGFLLLINYTVLSLLTDAVRMISRHSLRNKTDAQAMTSQSQKKNSAGSTQTGQQEPKNGMRR